MGLDHWLNREIYLGTQYQHRETKVDSMEVTIKNKKVNIPTENMEKVSYELICWRKANHIHKWFVDNIQNGNDNCEEYSVYYEQILSFLSVLERVEEIKNEIIEEHGAIGKDISLRHRDELDKILPIEQGFFFGSSEYGEWYFNDVSYTISELKKELVFVAKNGNLEIEYKYNSSW